MSAIDEMSLLFFRSERPFDFGEKITGRFEFTPTRDFANVAIELHCQWRTHGRTEPRVGDLHIFPVAARQRLEAGQSYTFPVTISINEGPRTSRGYNEKLDWYAWPVLVPPGGQSSIPLRAAERELVFAPNSLVPGILQYELRGWKGARSNSQPWFVLLAFLLFLTCAPVFAFAVLESIGDGEGWGSIIGLIVLLAVGLVVAMAAYEAVILIVAERTIGRPTVTITLNEDADSFLVHIQGRARRPVTRPTFCTELSIVELTEVKQGTSTTIKESILWQRENRQEYPLLLATGEQFEMSLVIGGVPPGTPASRKIVGSSGGWILGIPVRQKDSSPGIEWRIKVEIGINRWLIWNQTYTLNVEYRK